MFSFYSLFFFLKKKENKTTFIFKIRNDNENILMISLFKKWSNMILLSYCNTRKEKRQGEERKREESKRKRKEHPEDQRF